MSSDASQAANVTTSAEETLKPSEDNRVEAVPGKPGKSEIFALGGQEAVIFYRPQHTHRPIVGDLVAFAQVGSALVTLLFLLLVIPLYPSLQKVENLCMEDDPFVEVKRSITRRSMNEPGRSVLYGEGKARGQFQSNGKLVKEISSLYAAADTATPSENQSVMDESYEDFEGQVEFADGVCVHFHIRAQWASTHHGCTCLCESYFVHLIGDEGHHQSPNPT